MRTPFSLKLTRSLIPVPVGYVEVSDVEVQGLGDDRAGGDGPVRPIRLLVLVVPLEQDDGIDSVDLLDISVVDVVKEGVEEEIKMFPTCRPSVIIVVRSNAKIISNIWFHFL